MWKKPDVLSERANEPASSHVASKSAVEIIALSGCSRPEDGRPCKICVGAAERHVKAVEDAGLVVVSAEDLKTVAHAAAYCLGFMDPDPKETDALRRVLAAALPERTENG